MRSVVILGSTGSVGTQALDVVRHNPDRFRVVGLSAGTNHELLTGQVREFPCPGGGDSQPYGIAVGTDGRIWYNESGKNEIVAFDPASERAETVAIPTPGSVVRNMAVDSTRARLWLALSGTQRLGRIDLPPSH